LRLLNNKKGQVRVIEAFFASMMLLGCLALIPAQTFPRTSTVNLVWKAQNVLLTLDGEGHLASLVYNRDWASIQQNIEAALPLTTWFNLTVYDKNQNILNPFPISNGGALSNNVVSYTYVCVSQDSTFSIYVLQLQLAVID
jgi:hypothetical protein